MADINIGQFKSPGIYTKEMDINYVPPVGVTPKMIDLLNLIMEEQGLTYDELWEIRQDDVKMNQLIREVKIKKLLDGIS